MNFDFNEDQVFIRDQARNFLAQESTPEVVRKVLDSDEPFDRELWQKIIDLGWTAMVIPEAYNGLGMGFLELCVIAEELGRTLAPVPFTSSVYLATNALLDYASEAQKKAWLPRLAAGELIGTLATAEGLGTLDIAAQVDGGTLSGCKLPVPDGDVADFALVWARDSDKVEALYIVDLHHHSVARSALNSIDPSRAQGKITFTNTPAEKLEASAGRERLDALYDKVAVLLAFEQIGGCEAAMEMGMAYTKDRYAFGRPVASFQAIKHKFADMYVAKELARSNAYYGAWALSTDSPDLPLAAATARVSAGDAYYLVSKENIQAHGGMGFTWEFDCHLYYRRAQLLSTTLGGQAEWKDKLATRLLHAA